MKKIQFTRKKWLIITVSSLVAVTFLGYVGYSLYSWHGYENNYQTSQSQTKSDLDGAMVLPMTSASERKLKLTSLQKVASDLKQTQSSMCQPGAAVQWQTIIGSFQDKRSVCQSIIDNNSDLLTALDAISTYLEDERTFATNLDAVARLPAVSDESNWADTAAAWHQLSVSSAGVKSGKAFESTKQAVVTAISGIDVAWQELISAHSAKDKPRFVSAQTAVATAYNGLSAITDQNNKQLTALDQNLTAAYKAAF